MKQQINRSKEKQDIRSFYSAQGRVYSDNFFWHVALPTPYRVVITLRRTHKSAQNELNLRLKVISFAIMTPSEQFYVS